jgi:5'-3' exonuclease
MFPSGLPPQVAVPGGIICAHLFRDHTEKTAMSRASLGLIDSHALAYRVFVAIPVQTFHTKQGEPTNAVFGFTRALLDILDQKPNYLAVTFDQGLSGRGEKYPAYKGTREKKWRTICATSWIVFARS